MFEDDEFNEEDFINDVPVEGDDIPAHMYMEDTAYLPPPSYDW